MSLIRTLLGVAMLIALGAANADTTLSFNDGRQPEPTSFLIKDGKVLMQGKDPDGGEFASIYVSSKNHFIVVDYGHQSYYIMDKAMLDKQMKLMEDMRRQMKQQMQAQMQQLPEDQRKMMQQRMDTMLNPPKPPPMKITNTGKTEDINGISCKTFEVYRGENRVREVCVAKTSAIKMSEKDYKTLRSMFAYMKDIAETMAKQSPMDSADGAMMADMEGVPVEMRDLRRNIVSRLEGVSSKEINAKLFEVPSSFKQVDPYAMMQQQMQQMHHPQ
jgi:hypothetical protein